MGAAPHLASRQTSAVVSGSSVASEDLEHGRLFGREPGLDRPGPQCLTRLLGDDQERPDPGPRMLFHAGRHGGIQCLAPGTGIVVRQPPSQLEHSVVD